MIKLPRITERTLGRRATRKGETYFAFSIAYHLKRANPWNWDYEFHQRRAAHNFRRLARVKLDPPDLPVDPRDGSARLQAWLSRPGAP